MKYAGKTFEEILEMQGKKPTLRNLGELMVEILEGGGGGCAYKVNAMIDLVRVMQHPLAMHSSDAGIVEPGKGIVHPRNYGSYPHFIAVHVRNRKDIGLEEMIRKMTSFPAVRIEAFNRGILSVGKLADIVVFDLNTIRERSTWEDSHQYSEGIDYVFVNGEIVVDHGEVTGKLPGRIIYGPGKEETSSI
jgi:N-acyl-D-aspartate/D-glutamate deacylase